MATEKIITQHWKFEICALEWASGFSTGTQKFLTSVTVIFGWLTSVNIFGSDFFWMPKYLGSQWGTPRPCLSEVLSSDSSIDCNRSCGCLACLKIRYKGSLVGHSNTLAPNIKGHFQNFWLMRFAQNHTVSAKLKAVSENVALYFCVCFSLCKLGLIYVYWIWLFWEWIT